MDIKALRNEYKKGKLKDDSVYENPVKQFEKWFEQALSSEIQDANAMSFATATIDGKPSVRTVLLKEFDENGFVFFTNYGSRKGKEIADNPIGAILFFWKELERQVRIEGKIEKTSSGESDAYFDSRTLESRISAFVSPQSQAIPDRKYLEDRWSGYIKSADTVGISRPENWGGYRLLPDRFEFWQGRPNRLHDRILYIKSNGTWNISRLAP